MTIGLRGKCNNCEERKDVLPASRFGGGKYNRAGRFYRSNICEECATDLKAKTAEGSGHHTISRWSIGSLDNVLARFAAIRASEDAASNTPSGGKQ